MTCLSVIFSMKIHTDLESRLQSKEAEVGRLREELRRIQEQGVKQVRN